MVIGLGASKSGTTWLWQYLVRNRNFLHSPIKELHFFSRMFGNQDSNDGAAVLEANLRDLVLRHRWILAGRNLDRVRALAQATGAKTVDDYLQYFSDRIGNESHFGEISPSYSDLSKDAISYISNIAEDVRFLFVMRDPAARAVSHIGHLRRRGHLIDSVDAVIESIDCRSRIYRRSNYGQTLDNIAHLGNRACTLVYEDLFNAATLRSLCDWLGLPFARPDFSRRVNAARSASLSEPQKQKVRERLEPIYRDLDARFGGQKPQTWQW